MKKIFIIKKIQNNFRCLAKSVNLRNFFKKAQKSEKKFRIYFNFYLHKQPKRNND